MCYNSNCTVEIKSCIDGETSVVSSKGKIIKSPSGYRVDYSLDGDECSLIVNERGVVQKRRGEQNIELTFKIGESTQCSLSSGSFKGDFSVYTDDLHYGIGNVDGLQVFMLSMVYLLGEQRTEIVFSAKYTLKGKI